MSRNIIIININTTLIVGMDSAVGRFMDITDKRFAKHPEDIQGEGFVLEWNDLFKTDMCNLIGATEPEIHFCLGGSVDDFILLLQPKVEAFISQLPPIIEADDVQHEC